MMKKVIGILFVFVLLVSCSCAYATVMSDQYDNALTMIMCQEYREAAALLDEISIYEDASLLSLYCKSLAEGMEGHYTDAYKMLDMLGNFKDAKIWSIYFQGIEAEEKGDRLSEDGYMVVVNGDNWFILDLDGNVVF